MRIQDNIAAGMSAEEARRDALVRFGNQTVMKEQTTEVDAALFLESIWDDVRYSLRQLRKSPGFAVTTILTLALGIGPNTAVFSVMNSVLLRPLSYPQPDRIVQLEKGTASDSSYSASIALFLDWRKLNNVFEILPRILCCLLGLILLFAALSGCPGCRSVRISFAYLALRPNLAGTSPILKIRWARSLLRFFPAVFGIGAMEAIPA